MGDEITLAATGGASGLPVSFAITEELLTDGSAAATGAVATLTDGVLTLIGAGTATITASQNGDETYAEATDVEQTITVRVPNIFRVTETGAAIGASTWTNVMTLQAALGGTLLPGDQIWIAAGTYKPGPADDGDDATDERAAKFTIPEGVRVYGGFVGDEADDFNPATTARTGAATILSGDLLGNDIARPVATADQTAYTASRDDNSGRVVFVTGANVVLDGLTITAGEGTAFGAGLLSVGANTAVTVCTFTNNTTSEDGGGAFFTEAGATLTDCAFTGNMATRRGGGAFFEETGATLTRCTFTDNTATEEGGGAYFASTSVTLTDGTFTDNTATEEGGGAYFATDATLTGCAFTGNMTTTADGGGAFFLRTATLTNGVFAGNTATESGGGLYLEDGGTVINTTFYGNMATENGGGLSLENGGTVINSTFYNNTATGGGGGVLFTTTVDRASILRNSILVGNMTQDAADGHQAYIYNMDVLLMNIQHNLIEDGATGETGGIRYQYGITAENTVNAAAAAVFASTMASEANYLRLKEGSPAISAGNNDYLNNGTPDNTEDDVTTDLAGDARIQGGTVDLGAYESDTKLAQTIAFTLPTTGTVGEKPDLIATSDVGLLPVTFASSNEAVAAIGMGADAGKLVLKTAGSATITASQSGDDTYAAATAMQTIMVEAAGNQPQTITFMLAGTGVVGDKIALNATAESGLPVSYASSDETVASIGMGVDAGKLVLKAEGTATITASQVGNAMYAPAAPVTQMITVEAAGVTPQVITFMLAGTGVVGDKIALVATANSGLPVSYASSDETVASIGTGANAGKLVLETAGTAIITASQVGSTTYAPATPVTQMITVGAPGTTPQMIMFTLPATGTVGDVVPLAATTDATGLFVSFAITPATGVATLTDDGTGDSMGSLTLVGEGMVTITASQAGSATYAPATETQSIMVSKRAQTITFTLATTGMVNEKITLSAMTDAMGLNVSFAINPATGIATLVDNGDGTGMLTLMSEGAAVVTASQSGNDTYAAGPPVMQTITVRTVLGLEDAADGFGLFPNPTSGKLHFSEQVAEFRLYGIEGRLLETGKNVRSVDITARPAGLYFVEVVRGERSLRWRILRE